MKKNIPVTKTFLPPLEDYMKLLKPVWETSWLTNRGKLVLSLEKKLSSYLKLENILITNNGTIPLQISIKALNLKGEIITTPFSYIATTTSILWENCTPVYVDIHPEYLTLDESKIEAAITSKTTAILATHVYGNPCEVEKIEAIAKRNNLKVIYDAAHCFGVNYKGESIFNYGDVSTCSFHATKIFQTAEGGAIFCRDRALFEKIYYHHNFGHKSYYEYHGLGINGKISELQAAMGLAVFPYMDHILEERKKVVNYYNINLNLDLLQTLKIRPETEWNYCYYPIIFSNEETLLKTEQSLRNANINTRRYFYPSLNTIEYIGGKKMPISESVASRILCLPLYVGLQMTDLELIVSIVNQHLNLGKQITQTSKNDSQYSTVANELFISRRTRSNRI